jgi:hypothetical protein
MVIHPGDTTTLGDPYMILSFLRWTVFSPDTFDTFSGHRDVACWCSSIFYQIASLDTADGAATVMVPLNCTLK